MNTTTTIVPRATIDDLERTPDKAELIGGRIVHLMATGRKPSRVAFQIARSLDDHALATGRGEAYTDNTGFVVPELASGRESFCPDAAYFLGPFPADDMKSLRGAPALAVEVRSKNDYSPSALVEMAEKRRDYFEAGTEVVWDVDPIEECVHVYKKAAPDLPVTFRRDQEADAEPAVPGWRVALDWIFSPRRTEPS